MASGLITSWHIDGETIAWAPRSLWKMTTAIKLKDACSLEAYKKAEALLCLQRFV